MKRITALLAAVALTGVSLATAAPAEAREPVTQRWKSPTYSASTAYFDQNRIIMAGQTKSFSPVPLQVGGGGSASKVEIKEANCSTMAPIGPTLQVFTGGLRATNSSVRAKSCLSIYTQ